MIGRAQTKLIIVCDDKTTEYGNYLRQLISANDDESEEKVVGTKDGSIDTVVYTRKEYEDNKTKISSNQHVLFIGRNKTSENEINNMETKFDKHGMKYGWLGKRGMMIVDDALLNREEYSEFIRFCATYKQYFDKLVYKNVEEKETAKDNKLEVKENKEINEIKIADTAEVPKTRSNKAAKFISKAATNIINNILEPAWEFVEAGAKGAADGIKTHIVQKEIEKQQYKMLTVILYLDGLNEFLEG